MKNNLIVWVYPLILFLYSIYSFAYTDPNLFFSYNPVFLSFQHFMWDLGQSHRLWSTLVFISLTFILFSLYLRIVQLVEAKKLRGNVIRLLLVSSMTALLFSYPALSHDVFNYLFNAKMVLTYGANPHTQVALSFPQDEWTRFMHNTHTPAPYGYGFTLLSLIPAWLGAHQLKLTLMLFRLFAIASYVGVLWLQWILQPKAKKRLVELVLFGLNPLLLIEIIGNMHNDLTMMFFALLSLYIARTALARKAIWLWIPAILVLAVSISIKYASVMVIAGVLLFYICRYRRISFSAGGALTLAHLLPLLSGRSQRYLPWYLSWSMVFLPFTEEKWLKHFIVAASAAALLSYVPFLYRGEYTQEAQLMRTLIAFLPPLSLLVTQRLLIPSKRRA